MMRHLRMAAIALLLSWTGSASAAETDLEVVITGVERMVQVRDDEDAPWKKAEVGMKLGPGAEFRTGPRSAVQFRIPPDQTVTLDRLGTMKVLAAVQSAQGKVTTDLGLKYGRTRYEIEAAGVEHASTIHTPSAQLAVRGTEVGFQEDFTGVAWCNESHAFFRGDRQQQIVFGSGSEVSTDEGDPGRKRLADDRVDTKDSRSRDRAEKRIILEQLNGVLDLHQNKLLEHKEKFGSSTGTNSVQNEGDLQFQLGWNNSESNVTNFANVYYDLDLFVIAPNDPNKIIYAGNNVVPTAAGTIQNFVNLHVNPNAVVTNSPTVNLAVLVTDNGDLGVSGPVGPGNGLRTESIRIQSHYGSGDYLVGVNLSNHQSSVADPTPNDVTYQIKATKFIVGIGEITMPTQLVDFVIVSQPLATHQINVPAGNAPPDAVGFITVPRSPPSNQN